MACISVGLKDFTSVLIRHVRIVNIIGLFEVLEALRFIQPFLYLDFGFVVLIHYYSLCQSNI